MSPDALDPPVAPAALAAFREGTRLHAAGDLHGALAQLQQAHRLAGEHPAIVEALGVLAFDGGDLDAAERLLRHAHTLQPSVQKAARLAVTLVRRQRHADALPLLESVVPALGLAHPLADALATCREQTGDRAGALQLREQILAQVPLPAAAQKLAAALDRAGEHERLAACLPDWLARWPDAPEIAAAAAINALGLGDFASGWSCMRRRVGYAGDSRLAALPAWNGQRSAATLVLTLEPHPGEEILMSSLLPALLATGQPVLAEVDARLLPLFARSFPGAQFVPRDGGSLLQRVADGGHYCRATGLDLAERFRIAGAPSTPAWLRADPQAVARKQQEYTARWPGKRRIGLSWRSVRLHEGRERKSVPLAALARTLALPGVVFVDLQYGDFRADVDALPPGLGAPWRDPAIDPSRDLDALAAQLCALDAFVTVSNTTAHLAGALGVPTLVLLPRRHPVLWHWMFRGERTPWYDSVRLLRNPEDTGWAALDAMLADRLAAS